MTCGISRQAGLSMSPCARKERAQEKREQVLAWLLIETWSVFSVLQQLLRLSYATTHALMKGMEREGLTRSRALFVPAGNGVRRMILHGLTPHGAAVVQQADARKSVSAWEPSKVSPSHVMHQILTQEAHLRALKNGWTQWRPTRALTDLGLAKLPDADALSPDGHRVAIEVERFLKTPKRYEAILGAYIFEMKNGHWDRVDYLCPDAGFAMRLASAFGRLERLRLERPKQITRSAAVEPAHLERFRFYVQDDWPEGTYKSVKNSGVDK